MNNIRKYTAWLGAGAILITLATGCTNKDGDAVPDATENVVGGAASTTANVAGAMDNTASNMAAGADNVATAAGNKMENAGTAVANTAVAAGGAVAGAGDAAIYTPKIKTAIGAEKALMGSTINVDTIAAKKTIALRGTVKSAAQKTMASAIAKKNAPADYKIDNQLKMGAM